ncbi:hypothetical protein VTO42DRAFT_4864 [Malbranchea cinnamomea]
MSHSSPQSTLGRERERESRDRDREILERQREMQREEEMMQREREIRERDREQAERYHREQQQHHPVQSHAGSIPIHQPVASKVGNSIHGPNGLLSNMSTNASNNPPGGVQGSNPSGGLYGGGQVQHAEGPPRQYHPQVQGPPSQPYMGLSGSAPSQVPNSVATLSQGQQPILNDALTYLDQVKVRFVDQPDVYNRFLDIMKDFKSQAIDTPGVIQRVSALFNGHPALIQGFNTFLPAGYRIECGTEENPDAIRVTTPSGTNTISMQNAGRPSYEPGQSGGMLHRPEYYEESSRPGWQQPQPHAQQPPQESSLGGPYSPRNRMPQAAIYGQHGQNAPQDAYEYQRQHEQQAANAAALAHQQEQRGVSQLPTATTAGPGRPSMMQVSNQTPGPSQPMGSAGMQGAQTDASKRGPVEFNHAISYVNKIKNRFADTPDIYKQFLEILQTYQRESKPIQDVYAQVTLLFSNAPDLLEDFKQFLPESAAQAKVQPPLTRSVHEDAPISNIRGEPGYGAAASMTQGQAPRGDVKMPPLGQFNVKDSTKDGKKRRGGPGAQPPSGSAIGGVAPSVVDSTAAQANRAQATQIGNANKRTKLTHKPSQPDAPVAVSPTLVPALPEPLPPNYSLTPSTEEYAFFDRVKKYIGNKQNFAEFLKLCNLYAADLIDRNVLINRVAGFIGGNQEIMSWFKRFLQVDAKDEVIEPKPKVESEVVNLAHCRALGPSYRLLPKRERQKPCSGRDELCQSVLNDEWASHPTWASEDSGFVAHKKNTFEDSMHRIEEDRHDYDHHIEAAIRTIQLMEPLVQQISMMSEAERANFKLPPGLGGQSETIYRRVIKKLYDRQHGQEVIEEMFENPCGVLPVVLSRLKAKTEEWKAIQREWDKVWREMMQKGYYRSLDHQAIINKGADKRIFTAKNLQNEIQTKVEEALALKRSGYQTTKWQYKFEFTDSEVILDAARLLLCYIDHNTSSVGSDPQKVVTFIKDFVTILFGMDREAVSAYLSEAYESTPASEAGDDESMAPEDGTLTPTQRSDRKKRLLQEVLERSGEKLAAEASGVSAAASRPTTPGSGSLVGSTPTYEKPELYDFAVLKWMEHPSDGNFNQRTEYSLNEPYKRKMYLLYGNLSIYCFIRAFESLYSRLLRIKQAEGDARESVRRGLADKPAYVLGMIDKSPADLLYDVDEEANLYHQIVRMAEDVIAGDLEASHMEETLRRYYLKHGWQLYSIEKLLQSFTKTAALIFPQDSKDKTAEIMNLFFKEREREETTHAHEIQYRKQVQKLTKDLDVYRFGYSPESKTLHIQYMTPEDTTLETEELTADARWSYYVSAYTMRDPTEGVQFSRMRMPFLKRNLPPKMESDEEYNNYFKPLVSHEGLIIRIDTTEYHIVYEPGTEEWWYRVTPSSEEEESSAEQQAAVKEKRRDRFMEKFVNNPVWAQGLSKDEVDQLNQRFRSWVGEISPRRDANVEGAVVGKGGAGDQEDTEMTDAP